MATVVIGSVLLGVVAIVIGSMVKDRKAGKSSCGGCCEHCSCGCHNKGMS